jgi:predicted AAA+ superfamily ATPase
MPVQRKVLCALEAQLRAHPAVKILGPRQCGKTTLARAARPAWTHVDLERPADLAAITRDPEAYFTAVPRNVVIDEAQRAPELFAFLRHWIDRDRRNGSFLLLGSASPALVRDVAESLAGRVGHLELTPFRADELDDARLRADRWFWGGFPPVLLEPDHGARVRWLESYVKSLLEADLPALGLRLPAVALRTLWTMLTHVHGGLLNASELGRSLDVYSPTVARYLDALEGTFMIRRLRPHFANVSKRLVKSPKVYVPDTGLLHRLAGLDAPAALATWPKRGASFEGMVIEDLIARACDRLVRPYYAFWRTAIGDEIDLLIGTESKLFPIEIEVGVNVDARDLAACAAAWPTSASPAVG